MATTTKRRQFRLLAFAPAVLLTQFVPQHCAPAPAGCATISWPGRPPVCVTPTGTRSAQGLLDAGRAVDLSGDTNPNNGAHVAGHFSSHGAVFAAGPNLRPGLNVDYAGRHFTVRGTTGSHTGARYNPPPAGTLVVQYSGCGGVCLVSATST
jgi:hypothetical protein